MSTPGRLSRHLQPRLPALRVEPDAALSTQTVLSTIGIIVQGVVRFLYSVLIGNVFGKAVLGAVNAGISAALFTSLLMPTAAAMTATKFVARARGAGDLEQARAALGHLSRSVAVVSLLIGAGCAAIAGPLLHLSLAEAVLTGALAVSYSGYMFIRGMLFGLGMVARATVWDGLSALASTAGLGLVIVAGAPAWLLLPLVVGYGAYVVANWPPRSTTKPTKAVRKEMNSFLFLALINSVASSGFLQLSMVAAQHWDRGNAGSFAAALSLATPASLVSRSLSLVLFPSLAAAHGRGDTAGASHQTDLASRGLVVVSIATFGPLMLVSPTLIAVFFPGAQFRQAALLLPPLLGAVMVVNMVIGATNSLLTRELRFNRIVVWASVLGSVVGLLWWILRAPTHGVESVAWGYLAGSIVLAIIPVVALWRIDRLPWTGLVLRTLAGSAVLVAAVWWEQASDASVLGQFALALAFTALWLVVCASDLRRLIRAVGSRGSAEAAL